MNESVSVVPAHVSPELVMSRSLDSHNLELGDPFVAAARLYDGPPLVWNANAVQERAGWIATRHDLIQEVFLDTETFSSDRNSLALIGVDWKLNPLEYDPPEHQIYRKVLNPYFSPKIVSQMDGSIRAICDTLIAEFSGKGRCEFTRDFAEQFPSYVFLDLMGLPREKLDDFLKWERMMIHGDDIMERFEGFKSVLDYLDAFVRQQSENPTTELWQGIFSARIKEGRPLTHGEVMGMCFLLYIGGLDTVFSTLGWIFRHLAGDQALQNTLRENPDKIPAAVDEFLRAFPVATPERIVTKDTVLHGVELRKGDAVFLPTYLAGRDPAAYENPEKVDIERNSRHLTLASGPHACLGMHLAKRELRTVIEVFLQRFKNVRIPVGKSYEYKVGGVLTVTNLPLEWDPA